MLRTPTRSVSFEVALFAVLWMLPTDLASLVSTQLDLNEDLLAIDAQNSSAVIQSLR